MLNTNDIEIINLTLKSKRANRAKNVGYVAIPFVVLGLISVPGALITADRGDNTITGFAMGCIAMAIPFSVLGVVNGANHTAYKKEIVKLYNQKY